MLFIKINFGVLGKKIVSNGKVNHFIKTTIIIVIFVQKIRL